VNRTLIVAKIKLDAYSDVANIFAASDRTGLPRDIGVKERNLYALEDLYVHVIDFEREPAEAMQVARRHPGFTEISEQLRPYVSPYNPATWHSPNDAMAKHFYRWHTND
jgi:cyclase